MKRSGALDLPKLQTQSMPQWGQTLIDCTSRSEQKTKRRKKQKLKNRSEFTEKSVFGISHDPQHAGISGHNPGGLAGFFDGNVTVTGDVFLAGADCAERFASAGPGPADPGTVMSIQEDGSLSCCEAAYDRRVAGVVSGAGTLHPAIILNSNDPGGQNGTMLALVGRVYCKVDASYAPIGTGDLLTTSPTPGPAMKVSDPLRGFGAVLGKALMPCSNGCGLIPILVALQ